MHHHHRRDDPLFDAEASLAEWQVSWSTKRNCSKRKKNPLREVERDLAEGKDIVRTEKRKLNRIKKGKLKKKNAERALVTLMKGVEATEEQLGLLEEKVEQR